MHAPVLEPASGADRTLTVERSAKVDKAKAALDALNAEVVKTPAERHLLLPLLAAREMLDRHLVDRLLWIDTRAMLADGLTKGAIDRAALVCAGYACRWLLEGTAPVVSAVRVKAAAM